MATITFSKLDPAATLPTYPTVDSAGMTLHSLHSAFIAGGNQSQTPVPTGLHVFVPTGFEAQIRPYGVESRGYYVDLITLDPGFSGELVIYVTALWNEANIGQNEIVAQLVLVPVEQHTIDEI